MHAQATATTVVPDRRRLVALEDSRDWLQAAIAELGNGNAAGAVHAVHTGIGFAALAQDSLVELLVWDGNDDEEPGS